ncbi:MAG: hypothetical protein ACRDY2_06835 [Acidimicrobiales bacterium]
MTTRAPAARAGAAEARREQARAQARRGEQLRAEAVRRGQQRANHMRAVLLAAGPAVAAGIVAFVATWAGSFLALAAVVGAYVAAQLGFLLWALAPWLVTTLVRAARPGPLDQPRTDNLLEGLCASAGVLKPQLWLLGSEEPNMLLAVTHPRSARLVVTTGLLSRLSRVELEGVLAREVAKLRSGAAVPATVAVAAGWPIVVPRLARARLAASSQASADLAAVSLTCYPPGLAAALERLADSLPVGGLPARLTEALWLASPSAPAVLRVAALRQM